MVDPFDLMMFNKQDTISVRNELSIIKSGLRIVGL